MTDLSFVEAWKHWAHGKSLLDLYSWYGKSFLFWGRCGKIAEFIGVLTILADSKPAGRRAWFGCEVLIRADNKDVKALWYVGEIRFGLRSVLGQ